MDLEAKIKLNRFSPRPYQIALCDAVLNKGYRKAIAIWPRRAGKDIVGLNIAVRECIKRPIVCFYVFPTYSQGRKILWDSLDNHGHRIIDYYIPQELVESKNIQQMQIRFKNGSLIQVVGSDNIDNLVGTNCNFVVYSEYALQSPLAYQFIRPILAANDGKCIFLSTPRGKNHLWEMFQIANQSHDWFCEMLTLDQTNHIPLTEIEKDRQEGVMSDDMIQQEYYCFPAGQQVLTSDGCRSIEDIKPNDLVVSHTGRLRKVSDTISRDYVGQLYHISSYGSCEPIICTPNHPLRVYDRYTQKYIWKEACFIETDDRLVFPKMNMSTPEFATIISEDLCNIIAWYITEGSCSKNSVQFTVNRGESGPIGSLIRAHVPFEQYNTKTAQNIVINSTQWVDFFKSTCGNEANNKRIPFHLILGHEDEFFHELIKGDGCYSEAGDYKKYSYTTVSKTLAYQIQLLANSLGLGYAAGITKRDASISVIEGRKVNCQESYQINISFPGLRNGGGKLIRAKHSIAAKVTSIGITQKFEGKVYNLKVQYDESYLVGGRAVHNCSFDKGVEGSYYIKYLDRMRLNQQVGQVPWESGFKVMTAWDLGMRDSTCVIFFQIIGQTIRIIDCYENSKEGLEHYVKVLDNKPYSYSKHIAPHDIKVRELGTGVSRLEKARQLGVKFVIAPDLSVVDGIEAVRTTLSRVYIDEVRALPLLKALENYRQEYDVKRKVYKDHPLHDNYSHMADAMRYLAISLPKTRDGLTADDIDKNYAKARLGADAGLPSFFRDTQDY